MSRFTLDQTKKFERVTMLCEILAEIKLKDSDCPLLHSQLDNLILLIDLVDTEVSALRESLS